MAAETAALRTLARRVKQAALEKAEFILNNPNMVEKELYNETYLTVLKNAVPRTQELTGEDGEKLEIKLVSYADNPGQVSAETLPDSDN